jgi:hypothetical protein
LTGPEPELRLPLPSAARALTVLAVQSITSHRLMRVQRSGGGGGGGAGGSGRGARRTATPPGGPRHFGSGHGPTCPRNPGLAAWLRP